MSIWWIKNKDVPFYNDLMHKEGAEGRIIQTQGQCSQVQFTNSAMTTWVQCGFWYGSSPTALPSFYYKLKNKILSLFLRR